MQKFGQQEKQNAVRDAEMKQAKLAEATTPEVALEAQKYEPGCSCGSDCGCSK